VHRGDKPLAVVHFLLPGSHFNLDFCKMPGWAYMKEIKTRSGLFLSSRASKRKTIAINELGTGSRPKAQLWQPSRQAAMIPIRRPNLAFCKSPVLIEAAAACRGSFNNRPEKAYYLPCR
jgi:hypothetical protein